jgi:hypothetical protein
LGGAWNGRGWHTMGTALQPRQPCRLVIRPATLFDP